MFERKHIFTKFQKHRWYFILADAILNMPFEYSDLENVDPYQV